ncbi:hypothetical protein ACFVXC_06870 [Streptomyces sp. NPDC058257]|uniref:hypothetical protein n=1 Tax=Streptomyces sp. NPDC058257 TaxID=3346409 RepID=UPI0036EC5F63
MLSHDPVEISDKEEPIEPADRALPIEPIDNAEPTDPTDSTEPTEPIDNTESCDHNDRTEPVEVLRADGTDRTDRTDQTDRTNRTDDRADSFVMRPSCPPVTVRRELFTLHVVSAPVPPLWGPVPNDVGGFVPCRIGLSARVEYGSTGRIHRQGGYGPDVLGGNQSRFCGVRGHPCG